MTYEEISHKKEHSKINGPGRNTSKMGTRNKLQKFLKSVRKILSLRQGENPLEKIRMCKQEGGALVIIFKIEN